MKKIMILALALTVLFSAPSCKRRPLSDADYNVNVVFNIDQNILNGPEMTEPEMMRVAFFDHNNGNLVAQAYLPPQGGQVSVLPGRSYDVLAYNFGTQVTFIQNENNFGRISATTNQIADSFKSKLKSRGTRSPGDETEEAIVYDPDHLFVGRLMNVDMPARSVESPEVDNRLSDSRAVVDTLREQDQGCPVCGFHLGRHHRPVAIPQARPWKSLRRSRVSVFRCPELGQRRISRCQVQYLRTVS